MTHKVYYLAGPYSHRLKHIQEKRFQALTHASAVLMSKGFFNFSPITQSHEQVKSFKLLKGSWAQWCDFDSEMLRRCDELIVYKLPGWDQSIGVSAEIALAKALGKPIVYLDPKKEFEELQ